eukprot:gene33493-41337_t
MGNLRIPVDFVIPYEASWPESLRGFELGKYVTEIRSDVERSINRFDKDDVDKLVDMGFILVERDDRDQRILTAFKKRAELTDSPVHPKETVPYDDAWPEETHGLNLGFIMNNIRCRGLHKPIHADLRALGFNLDPISDSPDYDRIKEALMVFKEQNRTAQVPANFIVPEGDESYPKFTWGMSLGGRMISIVNSDYYREHREELEELGVVYKFQTQEQSETILHALTAYRDIHKKVFSSAEKFTVPANDPRYPRHTWGVVIDNNGPNYVRNAELKDKLRSVGY